jgi:hypothetical protein
MFINIYIGHVKYLLILSQFKDTCVFPKYFRKILKYNI